MLGDFYPEIVSRSRHISQVIKAEEESFGLTLDRGLELFGNVAEQVEAGGGGVIGGEDAFKLYDTYGFPLDLTVMMAREKGLAVDEESFGRCMESRREQSRAESKFAAGDIGTRWVKRLEEGARSEFVGYQDLEVEVSLLGADAC